MKTNKRLLVDVSPATHKLIKVRAAQRNISMKAYVEKAVLELIRKEEQYEKAKE